MCGIVALLIRDRQLETQLGSLIVPMVGALGARGPDSTGIAFYRESRRDVSRVSVHRHDAGRWEDVVVAVGTART